MRHKIDLIIVGSFSVGGCPLSADLQPAGTIEPENFRMVPVKSVKGGADTFGNIVRFAAAELMIKISVLTGDYSVKYGSAIAASQSKSVGS